MPTRRQDREVQELEASYIRAGESILAAALFSDLPDLVPITDDDPDLDHSMSSNSTSDNSLSSNSLTSNSLSSNSMSIDSEHADHMSVESDDDLLIETAAEALKALTAVFLSLRDEVINREKPAPRPQIPQLGLLEWSRLNDENQRYVCFL